MGQKVARLGDTSSHGGVITTASTDVLTNGVGTARTGDLHSCPVPGHGVTALTGTSKTFVNGRRKVLVGDVAGCGAVIVTGSATVTAS